MGITERREREREEVRRKILDAARDLFAERGYDHVTMRAVAEAIEYSPTAIYHHFEDKDDLVEALCHEDFARLLGVLETQPPPPDPVEWIRQLGRAYAAFGLGYPNHYRFMFLTPKRKVKDKGSPGEQSFALLRTAVSRAIDGGQFCAGDVDGMSQVLWAGLHGAVSLLTTLRPEDWPHAPAAADLVEQVIEHGIAGFLREPPER